MFSTYASLIGKSKTGESRLNQLIEWFGKDYDGVLVFDECHRAKNLCPKAGTTGSSLIGRYVVELQRKLPKARVVYASATGATEPRNMAYMERLGMWGMGTAFKEFVDFLNVIERRGMGAMELVAMDMKVSAFHSPIYELVLHHISDFLSVIVVKGGRTLFDVLQYISSGFVVLCLSKAF